MADLHQEGSHDKTGDLAGMYDSRGRLSAPYLQWLALLSLTGVYAVQVPYFWFQSALLAAQCYLVQLAFSPSGKATTTAPLRHA